MPRIVTGDEARPDEDAILFRQSARPALIAAAASVAALAALGVAVASDRFPWPVAAGAGAFLALFLLVALATLRHALAPDAWLLARDGPRVLVRARSYLNRRPGEAHPVVEIGLGEVAAVREARLDVRGRDALNESRHRSASFLELELRPGIGLAEVAEVLRRERQHRGRAGTWRHYPLTIAGERTLRVEWRSPHARITPGLPDALRVLGEGVRIGAATREGVDLGEPRRAPANEDTLRELRTLIVQGRVFEATILAQRALGLDTTKAKALVDRISERAD